MVASTATHGLRYPQMADRPCDGDLHLQYLAEDVDAKLDSHDADQERAEFPPVMLLSLTTVPAQIPTTFGAPGVVPDFADKLFYDTVEYQAGGLFADLNKNPYQFTFPRTGYYHVGINLEIVRTPAATDVEWVTLFAADDGSATQGYTFDNPSYVPGVGVKESNIANSWSMLKRITSTTTKYEWRMNYGGDLFLVPQYLDIASLRVWAVWTGDL